MAAANDLKLVMDAIYGESPPGGRYATSEVSAAQRLVQAGMTPARARVLMEWVRGDEFWAPIIQQVKHLEKHLNRISASCDRELNAVSRPYDHKPEPYVDKALKPHEMFPGSKHPDVAKRMEELRAQIADAEARGFKGPALMREVLGHSFDPGNVTRLPPDIREVAKSDPLLRKILDEMEDAA